MEYHGVLRSITEYYGNVGRPTELWVNTCQALTRKLRRHGSCDCRDLGFAAGGNCNGTAIVPPSSGTHGPGGAAASQRMSRRTVYDRERDGLANAKFPDRTLRIIKKTQGLGVSTRGQVSKEKSTSAASSYVQPSQELRARVPEGVVVKIGLFHVPMMMFSRFCERQSLRALG
eukprot:gene12257-biopygen9475